MERRKKWVEILFWFLSHPIFIYLHHYLIQKSLLCTISFYSILNQGPRLASLVDPVGHCYWTLHRRWRPKFELFNSALQSSICSPLFAPTSLRLWCRNQSSYLSFTITTTSSSSLEQFHHQNDRLQQQCGRQLLWGTVASEWVAEDDHHFLLLLHNISQHLLCGQPLLSARPEHLLQGLSLSTKVNNWINYCTGQWQWRRRKRGISVSGANAGRVLLPSIATSRRSLHRWASVAVGRSR